MEIIIYLVIYLIIYLFIFALSKSLDMFAKKTNKNLIKINRRIKYLFIRYIKDDISKSENITQKNSNYIGRSSLYVQIINYVFSIYFFTMALIDVINEPNYLNGIIFLPKLTIYYFVILFIVDFIFGFSIYIIVNESIPNLKTNKPKYQKGIKIFIKGFTNETVYTKELKRLIILLFVLTISFLQYIIYGFKYIFLSCIFGFIIILTFTLISTSIARFYFIYNKIKIKALK